jgi:dTDP-4-dehydrorhamnose reductase
MRRLVITGARGLLGRELCRAPWTDGTAVHALSSDQLDITDRAAVDRVTGALEPDVILNAAAFTAVDAAEDDPDRALAVNATAVDNLAAAADAHDALLIHFSTDYVFDGHLSRPYTEDDPATPLGVYGRSKAAGDLAAARASRSITLRVSWLYGALGSSFVGTMLRLAGQRDELAVVADQTGCPTAAADVATAVVHLVTHLERSGLPPRRLYHLASPEEATWYELAVATLECSRRAFLEACRPITTDQYPTRAARPANSRLDSSAIANDLGITLPPWSVSLPAVVAELEAAVAPGAARLTGAEVGHG